MVQALDKTRSRPLQVLGGRIPPHNLEAEESLLGAMLLSRDAIAAGVERCTAEDFYKPAHSHVFDAVVSLYAKGEPADPVTVADELRRTGMLDSVGDPSSLISLQAEHAFDRERHALCTDRRRTRASSASGLCVGRDRRARIQRPRRRALGLGPR